MSSDQNASKDRIVTLVNGETFEIPKENKEVRPALTIYIEIFKFFVPVFIGQALAYVIEFLNQMYVGRLGNTAITAGVGMGNMIINLFCMSIIMGVNSAV